MKETPLIQNTDSRILSLEAETRFAESGIVSRTVLNAPHARMVLFGFDAGQSLSEHTSTQHAVVQILSGECEFSLNGEWHTLKTGALLHMPPHLRHAVQARQPFSMLLTLFQPANPGPIQG